MKTIGIIFGILFLLLLLLAGSAYIGWQYYGDELISSGQEAMAEGRAYAADSSQYGCLEQAVLISQDCSSILCQTKAKLFLQACLNAASEDSTFCEGVPGQWEIMAMANWSARMCQDSHNCTTLVSGVIEYCSERRASDEAWQANESSH